MNKTSKNDTRQVSLQILKSTLAQGHPYLSLNSIDLFGPEVH